jgi:hypothetical protein
MSVPFPFISPQPHKKMSAQSYYRNPPTKKSQTNKSRTTIHLGTSLHNLSKMTSFIPVFLPFVYPFHSSISYSTSPPIRTPYANSGSRSVTALCTILSVRPRCSCASAQCGRLHEATRSTAAMDLNGFGYPMPQSEQNHRHFGLEDCSITYSSCENVG